MFRDIRKRKQRLPDCESIQILSENTTAVLGVLGDDGYPYTVPVNYVYEDGKIFLHGAKAGHKLDSIKKCPKVSLCVIAEDKVIPEKLTTQFKSVILFGKARILEKEDEINFALKQLGLKYNPNLQSVEQEIQKGLKYLSCIEITIEHLSGKISKE